MSRFLNTRVIGGVLLAAHAVLVAWVASRDSPVIDEAAHLAAGIYVWELHDFDLYRVNPPLVRALAALPVVIAGAQSDWSEYAKGLTVRPEWAIGRKLVEANSSKWRQYLRVARWACLPLSLIGAYTCYLWARELYGSAAGVLALTLWCFCPNIIAFAGHVTPDLGSAALGVAAGYALWRWLRLPSGSRAVVAGVMFGFAELTKATWIVLFALWPVLWLAWASSRPNRMTGSDWRSQGRQMAAILLIGLYVLNAGYLFKGTFQPLYAYRFASDALAGAESLENGGTGGNRFGDSWVGSLPVPLPESYVTGLDLQKYDFDRGSWSYLRGEWKEGGWWYFYVYALLIKVPLGTVSLAILALSVGRRRASGTESLATGELPNRHESKFLAGRAQSLAPEDVGSRDTMVLLAPAAAVLVLVSSETGFTHHPRYVLPVLPFAFVAIARLAAELCWRARPILTLLVAVCLLWSVGSSLRVYPHSLSYFNELAGGPTRGHEHLVSSAIDWGQDLFHLERWLDEHPEAQPLRADVYAPMGTRHPGISWGLIPPGPTTHRAPPHESRHFGPQPGWFAISVHRLHDRTGRYGYLLEHFEPTAMVGYSIVLV